MAIKEIVCDSCEASFTIEYEMLGTYLCLNSDTARSQGSLKIKITFDEGKNFLMWPIK